MRVFWFTNVPLPALSRALGTSPVVVGGWMSSLLDAVKQTGTVTMAVATATAAREAAPPVVADGVTYYCLPPERLRSGRSAPGFETAALAALDSFGPDLIHVHGTEGAYGLVAARYADRCPAVVSIQGLIHVYARHLTGGIRAAEALRGGPPGVLSWLRSLLQEREWERRGRAEKEILRTSRWLVGRTHWDKAHGLAVNPRARYFHCDEVLRSAFRGAQWNLSGCERHSIFCSASHSPVKGFHVLLDAVELLVRDFPDLRLRAAGAPWTERKGRGYYGHYIASLIARRGLTRHVTPLPPLPAESMAEELARAHVFAHPSFIDNSPNSLGEAMLVGTPTVASLVGGIPSMIDDGVSALGVPSGDAAYLAEAIRRVFRDDALAQGLSSRARAVALQRHDPAGVAATQLEMYRRVIADFRERTRHGR